MTDPAEDILRLQSVPVTTLARQPAAVCALARGLDDARPEVARAAAATLEKMVRLHRLRPQHMTAGFPAEARAILLDRLARSPAVAVRRLAADALREAEQVAAAAGFLDGLADPDAAVRASCLRALERLRLGPEHLDRVHALLAHARAEIRCAVLDALAAPTMDRGLLLALAPLLGPLLADPDRDVRVRAGHLLALLDGPPDGSGNEPPALWPVLVETLQHGTPWQRTMALRRLADQGPRALPHLPAVLAAAADHSAPVRSHALTALAAIAPDDARVRRALLAALADPASSPRRAAVSALAAGAPDRDTLDALARALDAPAIEVAEAAASVLGRMGPAARPAAAALERQLGRQALRLAAASALVAMGAVGPALRQALRTEAREGEDGLRELAESLLAELG